MRFIVDIMNKRIMGITLVDFKLNQKKMPAKMDKFQQQSKKHDDMAQYLKL